MTSPADRGGRLGDGLAEFARWLELFAPRHRALRTPVYLEPDAPAAMRALWEAVGFSDAVLPGISDGETRPERCFADPAAEKVVRAWFGDPRVRERWGIGAPAAVMAAVRAKLPEKTRWVRAMSRWAFLTDETSGADDPPVLELNNGGALLPSWPSYVEMVLWQACANVGSLRGSAVDGPAPEGGTRPFAPALAGFWALGEGVWGLGPCPAYEDGVPPGPSQEWRVLYLSPAHYFRFANGLDEEELSRQFVNLSCMHYFGVEDGKRLDPDHPSVPGFRAFQRRSGPGAGDVIRRGLVEVDGLRLWVEKRSGTATLVYAEPEQLAEVKAFFKREKLTVYEQLKPQKDKFVAEPTKAELAAAKKQHDRARAAAEGQVA